MLPTRPFLCACMLITIIGPSLLTIGSVSGQQLPSESALQQQQHPEALPIALEQISLGSERFSLDLLKKISDVAPNDFILSPFSVWSLLILCAEGAAGNTRRELESVLGLPDMLDDIRLGYSDTQRLLRVNTSTIQLALTQVLFTDVNRPVGMDFEDRLQRLYQADHVTVDFADPSTAYYTINDYISNQTHGRLGKVVKYSDLAEPQLMLISAIFFRGQWASPFNRSNTRDEAFYDETGQIVGIVPMMYQSGPFGYTFVAALRSTVLELTYGVENRLSMLFILPRKGESLGNVMELLRKTGIAPVLADISRAKAEFEDDDVEVFLPRFTTRSDFVLNRVLNDMGLLDIFSPQAADLRYISAQTFLSRIIHKAQIEVTEEGTVATAATVGGFVNKNTPPRFYANRPFAYLIIEKKTNLLLFCGQVKRPL